MNLYNVNKTICSANYKGFCDNLGMNTYADRLKQAMTKKGVNQSELARMIGVKPQAIQYLCREGKKSVHTVEIAKALDVDPEWLATGKPQTPATQKKIESNAGQDNSGTEHLLPHEDIPHDVRQIIQDLISLSSTDKLSPHAINMIKAVTETSKKQGDHDDKQK